MKGDAMRLIEKKGKQQILDDLYNCDLWHAHKEYNIMEWCGCTMDGKKKFLEVLETSPKISMIKFHYKYNNWYMQAYDDENSILYLFKGAFSFGYVGEGSRAAQWVLDVLGIDGEVPLKYRPDPGSDVLISFAR